MSKLEAVASNIWTTGLRNTVREVVPVGTEGHGRPFIEIVYRVTKRFLLRSLRRALGRPSPGC